MSGRIPAAAALLSLLLALCAAPAMAASPAAELPVRIMVSGDAPSVPETFTLTLRAASDDAPLPEGSRSGVYTCTARGGSTVTLTIPCAREGRYLYTLRQEPGAVARGEYDDRVYAIAVTADAGGCTVTAWLEASPEDGKCDTVEFCNHYRRSRSPKDPGKPSPKTGDGDLTLWSALALASGTGAAALGGVTAVSALLRRREEP